MCGTTPPPLTCCTCFILFVSFSADFLILSYVDCHPLPDANNNHFFIFLIKNKNDIYLLILDWNFRSISDYVGVGNVK